MLTPTWSPNIRLPPPRTPEQALDELSKISGTRFDGMLVRLLLRGLKSERIVSLLDVLSSRDRIPLRYATADRPLTCETSLLCPIPLSLSGQVALISGGSRGIGAATVRMFAACRR